MPVLRKIISSFPHAKLKLLLYHFLNAENSIASGPQDRLPTNAETPRFPPVTGLLHRLVFISFLICAALLFGSLFQVPRLGNTRWLEGLLLVLALATTLFSLARSLPAQNVVTAAALIVLMSGVVQLIDLRTGIPFGSCVYTERLGPRLFGLLPWPVPLIWTVAILNSRGIARLMLRPWRKTGKYGFWVIGLACLLTVVFEISLEPFASAIKLYWLWEVPKNLPTWQGTPPTNFLGCAVTTLIILAFVTPWLINKRPPRKAPPDYHPLIVWLILNLLPGLAAATAHLWWAAGFTLVASVAVAAFAWRGARW